MVGGGGVEEIKRDGQIERKREGGKEGEEEGKGVRQALNLVVDHHRARM